MNWGYRIVLAFVFFITFVVSLVIYISTKSSDLVAEDYYMQEVNYQNIIEAKKNSTEIKKSIQIKQDPSTVSILFPESVQQNIKGKIHFYHPQSSKLDVVKDIELTDQNILLVNKTELSKGNYTVKLSWSDGDKEYYIEKTCYVS